MIEAADQQMFSSTDGGLSESFCGFRQRTVPVTQYFGRLQFALLYVVLHFLGRNLNSESLAHHSFFTARRLLLGWAEIFQTHRCFREGLEKFVGVQTMSTLSTEKPRNQ
jgi:hypothetical protein